MGSGGIDTRFRDLGINWRRVVSFTPRPPLYPQGNISRYLWDKKLGGFQNRSGRRGEERIRYSIGTSAPTTRLSIVASHYTDCYNISKLCLGPSNCVRACVRVCVRARAFRTVFKIN
jgi:hypothetical protein